MHIETRFDDPSQGHDFILYDPPWPMHPMYWVRTERYGGGLRNVPYCHLNFVQLVAVIELMQEKVLYFNKHRKEELAILARADEAKKKAQSATVTKPTVAKSGQGSAGAS